jgi:aldehyde:ferredoxin oxidoreductase
MRYGYTGKLCIINLSKKTVRIEEIEEKVMRKYAGGKGLIGYYFKNKHNNLQNIDPLKEKNPLYLMTGIMSGIPAAGTSRLIMGTKSPITGGFGISESGGFIANEVKKSGWDGILIEGKSEKPVYILIKDQKVEIKDAVHLWGKGIGDTNKIIKEENNDKTIKMAQIGPAGENQIKYSCVINDLKHACGRNGMGAVMGSKKLKAIAVKGTIGIKFKNKDKIIEISKWYSRYFKENPLSKTLYLYGTSAGVEGLSNTGMLPTKNFKEGYFKKAKEISGQTMADTILIKREGCFACPVRCKRVVKVDKKNLKVDEKFGGPEYETIGAMGSLCGIGNLEVIAKGHELCNDLGLDTISTAVTIAFAMECYEKGIINKKITDGLDLKFGNEEALLKLILDTGHKKGFGKLISKGVKVLSEEFGSNSQNFAMHVKGQELPMHDPRGKIGVGLGYSLSPSGADHMQAAHDTMIENEGPVLDAVKKLNIKKPISSLAYGKEKAEAYAKLEKWWSFLNMAGVCDFIPEPRGSMPISKLIELLNASTGWDFTIEEALEVGERGINQARVINNSLNINYKRENLPERLFQPIQNGNMKDYKMDKKKFEEIRQYYFEFMGWDKNGYPKDETLKKLGL